MGGSWWEGPDSDHLYGAAGSNDLLCDSNGGPGGCTPNHGDWFSSGSFADTLWYESYGACTGELDPDSDAGPGDDTCGNDDDFSVLPDSCDIPTDTKPALCP